MDQKKTLLKFEKIDTAQLVGRLAGKTQDSAVKRLPQDEVETVIALLMDADPETRLVMDYLQRGECFVGRRFGRIVSSFILMSRSDHYWELMNIAVVPDLRGQGIGKCTLTEAIRRARHHGATVLAVGTGNSSLDQLAFYQRAGFRLVEIDRDFFTRNYHEPIEENGIPCRDMVRLELEFTEADRDLISEAWGMDGCRGGWLAVELRSQRVEFVPNVVAFLDRVSPLKRRIFIDIPCGLAEDHIRECDRLGRRLLGDRRNTMFFAPVRKAVYQTQYSTANQEHRRILGKGMSVQVWNICSKIRELDGILDADVHGRNQWHECHPELAFAAINRGLPLLSKKREREGFEERLELLTSVGIQRPWLQELIHRWPRADVAPDDILDAVVLGWAASLPSHRLKTYPSSAEYDARGIPMQLWVPQSL